MLPLHFFDWNTEEKEEMSLIVPPKDSRMSKLDLNQGLIWFFSPLFLDVISYLVASYVTQAYSCPVLLQCSLSLKNIDFFFKSKLTTSEFSTLDCEW